MEYRPSSCSVAYRLRTYRSETATVCCASPWGSRGSPNRSASRSSCGEKARPTSARKRGSINPANSTVVIRSASTTPSTPSLKPMTSVSRSRIVAIDRVIGQADEAGRLALNPQLVERDEEEAGEEGVDQQNLQRRRLRDGSEQVPCHGGRDGEGDGQHRAVGAQQEQEDRAGQQAPGGLVRTIVVHPHERRVDAPAKEDLRQHLDDQQQREHAVVARREEPDVDRQQQETDRLGGDVTGAVDRQVATE